MANEWQRAPFEPFDYDRWAKSVEAWIDAMPLDSPEREQAIRHYRLLDKLLNNP